MRKKYIAEFVYGSIDGTVTTFAIMAGALGAALSPSIVLILGFANLFADGFSMAVSNYLSRKSEQHLHDESHTIYDKKPLYTALITFFSFAGMGVIPLLPFSFAFVHPAIHHNAFVISLVLTIITFSIIGCVRGRVIGKRILPSILETLFIGGAAALIAFVVGYVLRQLVV